MYVGIRVKNMKKSVQFYTKQMGLKVVDNRKPVPSEEITSLVDKSTGQRINLMCLAKDNRMYTPWKENGVELDHLMFEVKDARKAFTALVKHGAPIAARPLEHERDGKRIVMGFVKDPNGIWVGVRSTG